MEHQGRTTVTFWTKSGDAPAFDVMSMVSVSLTTPVEGVILVGHKLRLASCNGRDIYRDVTVALQSDSVGVDDRQKHSVAIGREPGKMGARRVDKATIRIVGIDGAAKGTALPRQTINRDTQD